MKQDIAEYLVDSFIDFKGQEHHVVICALSQTPVSNEDDYLMVGWVFGDAIDPDADIYNDVYRTLSVGVAICNPCDEFDVEIGKKIAHNKASISTPKLVSLEQGVVNSTLVRAFMRQEMEYIKKYPGKFIAGYDESKARFDEQKNLDNEVKNLSNDEAEVVQAAMNGVDIVKCAKLARKLLDRKIHELEKAG